ncbi:helix-turn-helix domain-containing protein [Castellaniella sp. WN]
MPFKENPAAALLHEPTTTSRKPRLLRRELVAHDAEDHAHNLSQWEQSYSQFSPGRFEGRLTELWLPGMQIFQESANQALRQSCAAWPDALWFGLPAPGAAASRLDAQPIENDTLLFRQGGREFELSTPEHYGIYGIVVGKALLDEHFPYADALRLPDHGGTLRVPPELFQAIFGTLRQALFPTDPRPAATPRQILDLRETVLDQLGAALAHGTPPPRDAHHSRIRHSHQVVEQACELVLAQPDQRLSIADLCRQMHVSRRTLQYCFQAVAGMSPLTYLRILKLNQVRRKLRSADDPAGRVTRIAMTWGFEHLGQFSRDYRRLFGELPSNTLRHPAG